VENGDFKRLAVPPSAHRHVSADAARLDPMPDRVLDQSDEQHRRKCNAVENAVGFDREAEARAHADLEEVEVGPDQFELVAQIRLLATQLWQRLAQITKQ